MEQQPITPEEKQRRQELIQGLALRAAQASANRPTDGTRFPSTEEMQREDRERGRDGLLLRDDTIEP